MLQYLYSTALFLILLFVILFGNLAIQDHLMYMEDSNTSACLLMVDSQEEDDNYVLPTEQKGKDHAVKKR